jgi:glutamate--cysteine ligase catalytic subunit
LIGSVIGIENPEQVKRGGKGLPNMRKFLGDFAPCGLGL